MVYGGDLSKTDAFVIDIIAGDFVEIPNAMPGRGRFYHSTIEFGDAMYLIGGQYEIKKIS